MFCYFSKHGFNEWKVTLAILGTDLQSTEYENGNADKYQTTHLSRDLARAYLGNWNGIRIVPARRVFIFVRLYWGELLLNPYQWKWEACRTWRWKREESRDHWGGCRWWGGWCRRCGTSWGRGWAAWGWWFRATSAASSGQCTPAAASPGFSWNVGDIILLHWNLISWVNQHHWQTLTFYPWLWDNLWKRVQNLGDNLFKPIFSKYL